MADASSMGMTTALDATSLATAPTTSALAVVTTSPVPPASSASTQGGIGVGGAPAIREEDAVRTVQKRYDGLVAVRNKALRGKGAWYWAFLEPFLVPAPESPGVPKAVKLRCSLCEAVFSASNPSRTASEHLKRGTCPNFTSPSAAAAVSAATSPPVQTRSPSAHANTISTMAPSPHHQHHHHQQQQQQTPHQFIRKRSSSSSSTRAHPSASSFHVTPLAIMDPSHFHSPDVGYSSSATPTPPPHPPASTPTPSLQDPVPMLPPPPPHPMTQHLVLSGGKEDFGKLAMFEDSVKRLKSPKASPAPSLTKDQSDSALSLIADWVYECCGAVSPSSLDHPKFRAFLHQVGLPEFTRRDLVGLRLDARHAEVALDSRARIQGALFFQIASDGRWPRNASKDEDGLLSLVVNLPHGTSVFWKAVVTRGKSSSSSSRVPVSHATDILWSAVKGVSEDSPQRCAGIVSNRFGSALKELEERNPWMVNLGCLLKGFRGLVKDFVIGHSFVGNVVDSCTRVARFVNKSLVDTPYDKYGLGRGGGFPRQVSCFTTPSVSNHARGAGTSGGDERVFDPNLLSAMLEDVLVNSKLLNDVLDDVSMDDRDGAEIADIVRDSIFWEDLNAVHSLIKAVLELIKDVEDERPFVGQCLPLWEDIRRRVDEWCSRYNINHELTMKLVEKRFKKSYHPAWSAAFVLDPLYLVRDASGKYLPPFRYLTQEQEKHVYELISKLVPSDETHIAISELMKWRSDGLDRTYALAVQMKHPDPVTGKMRVSNPQSSRLVWESHLRVFTKLGNVAVRLIFLHATSSGFKCNPSFLRWVATSMTPQRTVAEEPPEVAQKMVFIAGNSKLERRDFSCEEEKDAELFAREGDDMISEAHTSAASV